MSHDEEPSAGASPEELARFYDEHDLTALHPGEHVEARAVREPMVSRSVRFDRETMRRLRAVAARRGLGVTRLMREWIVDRLEVEETGRHRSDIAAELERLARELRTSA